MKLLLDENLPHQLRKEISVHQVFTTAYMGWSGVDNGKLLAVAAENGFDALLTNDRGLEYEQNPATRPIAVVLLFARDNTIEAIRPLLPKLLAALESLQPRELVKIT